MTMLPPGLRHATGLPQCRGVVADVLDDFVEEDGVEGVVAEGQALGGGRHQFGSDSGAAPDALLVDVDAVDPRREVARAPDVGADAAADVEDARAFERDVASDEGEPAFLPGAPDVAGTAQSGGPWGASPSRPLCQSWILA